MTNSVSVAELAVDPKNCTISDIEHCEKGVAVISHVDEDGQPSIHKETDFSESYPAYYYCDSCGSAWDIYEGYQDEAWAKVKEHLDARNS